MNSYEQMLVFTPECTDELISQVLAKTKEYINRTKGTIIAEDILGKRRLAYPIGKHREGIYAVIQFSLDPSMVRELDTSHQLNQQIIRHLTIKLHREQLKKQAVPEIQKQEA